MNLLIMAHHFSVLEKLYDKRLLVHFEREYM